jgi:hypothetical protein
MKSWTIPNENQKKIQRLSGRLSNFGAPPTKFDSETWNRLPIIITIAIGNLRKKWKCSSEIIYKWVKQCHLHHPQSSLSLFTIPKWVMTLFYPHDTCGKVSSATFTENITAICRDCHCGVPSWIWPGNGKSPIYYMMFPYYIWYNIKYNII